MHLCTSRGSLLIDMELNLGTFVSLLLSLLLLSSLSTPITLPSLLQITILLSVFYSSKRSIMASPRKPMLLPSLVRSLTA